MDKGVAVIVRNYRDFRVWFRQKCEEELRTTGNASVEHASSTYGRINGVGYYAVRLGDAVRGIIFTQIVEYDLGETSQAERNYIDFISATRLVRGNNE